MAKPTSPVAANLAKTSFPATRLHAGWKNYPSSFAVLVLCASLSGCAVGPDYKQPDAGLPDAWHSNAASPAATMHLASWWRQFNDPVLNGLIDDALASSINLQTARSQLREARALRDLADGNAGPLLSVSASASRNKSGSMNAANVYKGGFDASWEPDIFGGLRRESEAAEAEMEASAENLHAVRISLVAEVARNYIELRTAERRIAVAESGLQAQQDIYDIARWRYEAGLVSGLDEAQALTQLQERRASLPALRVAMSGSRYRLAILLQRMPGELDARLQPASHIPRVAEEIHAGIPADTLRQRPDVRAAERSLAAQTARLGAAESDRYPRLQLSGFFGISQGGQSSQSLLAGLSAPLFDSGRIRSNITVQDARLEQSSLAYRAAVLAAVEDIENALATLASVQERQLQLVDAVASARHSWQLTQYQYEAGLADFQSVLESQRALLGLEDQLALNTGNYSTAQVQLYKALGGGWQTDSNTETGADEKSAPGAIREKT